MTNQATPEDIPLFGTRPSAAAFPTLPVAGWCLFAGLTLLGLTLAVAGTWPLVRIGEGRPGRGVVLGVPSAAVILPFVAILALALGFIASLLPQRRRKDPDEVPRELPAPSRHPAIQVAAILTLSLLVIGGVLLLILGYHSWEDIGGRWSAAHHWVDPAIGRKAVPHSSPASLPPIAASTAGWGITAVLAGMSIIALVLAYWMLRESLWRMLLPMGTRRKPTRMAQAVMEAAESGLEDLTDDRDPRRAVMACYRRFERAAAEHTHRRYDWQTPREYVSVSLRALDLPGEAVSALLGLFERARFGNQTVTEQDRQAAVDALSRIRAGLTQGDTHADHG